MFGAKKQIAKLKFESERAQEQLAALETRCTPVLGVLESMVEGVIIVAKDTKIVSINPSAEKIFGILKNQAEGKFFLESIRNTDIAELINESFKRGEFISKELTLVWPVQKTFQINASVISDASGVRGCLLIIHDITEIRRLEQMRRDFVANVSHELKTPLTSIKGFVETLLSGALDDKENSLQFLRIIQEHADRLDSLINDLLDLSRLESKETKLPTFQVNLKGLADKILAGFKSQIEKKSIVVENNIPYTMQARLNKDRGEQIFTNLIDNAIKFNRDNGSIKVYAEELASNIKITVEDSGIGIPPKDIPRIFERFYRVDKARSRELGGTGLGLSIVKHIVELHGGEVGVESTEGLGSKFWFILSR